MVGIESPLYTIRCYNDFFYRIVKRLYTPSGGISVPRSEFQDYDTKLSCALSRARTAVREYGLCNAWESFATFTIDADKFDRYDLQHFIRDIMQWFQNLRKTKYPRLKYLLIPEQHEDGAWHLHGFISGIVTAPLPPKAPLDLLEGGYLDWPDYRLRYGWCSLAPIRDPVAAAFYISKYVTKSLASLAEMKGIDTYYHSRGLRRSLPVGYVYHPDLSLDAFCIHSNVFYASGYFRAENITAVVDLCDEVSEMYQSFVIEDPVTHEIVGLAGGDSDDESFQMAIQSFFDFGSVPVPWDFPDESQRGRSGASLL